MYIKYNVIFVHVKMMNGDDSGKNQGSITGLSKNYNVFQVPNKNDRLTVDDKLDSPDYRNKVLVIGLGQLGLPVAKYVKEQGGFDTYGYDISTKAIDRAQKLAGIKRIGGNDGCGTNIPMLRNLMNDSPII